METRRTRELARREQEEGTTPEATAADPSSVQELMAPAAAAEVEEASIDSAQEKAKTSPEKSQPKNDSALSLQMPFQDDLEELLADSGPPFSLAINESEINPVPPTVAQQEVVMETNTEYGVPDDGEDAIRKKQKLDFVSTISSMRLKPLKFSRLKIPLCRLVPMPMVRPTLACDITKLEQDFAQGYEEGARVFYVSISNEDGQFALFSAAEKSEWGSLWNTVNDDFNKELRSIPELEYLVDAKFYVCDGNHRCIAWMRHISRLYSTELNWHYRVDSIILDTKGRVGVAMQVMHDINKHTEHSHVKTNLVHTLYRVKKYGSMPIEKFNELLSIEDIKACQSSGRKTWYSMPLDVFTSFIFQQEIAAAADLGVRKYHEETPLEEVTVQGVASAMRVATKESTDKLYKKLSKIVSVAHPALGEDWLQEIERHWSLYSVPELTLDKLQIIATSNASASHKVKWLRWLNSSGPTREARRFPPRPANDEKLTAFLSKACWYAGIEDSAVEQYESIIRSDNIHVNMEVAPEPESLVDYIENWRMRLWDHAFVGVFKGADSFKKSDSFKDFKGSANVVKRVLYRYFKFELLAKKAISKSALPPFLSSWLNRTLSDYMFSIAQEKNWPSSHLQGVAWYLECSQGFVPPQELALFQSLKESAIVEPALDEFAGLDPDARAKAIKRKEISDKKKAEKWEEARKKTEEMEAKKKERLAEKARNDAKEKQKGKKRKAEPVVPEQAVSEGTMKDTSSGFSLTQERLLHGPPPYVANLQGLPHVDECILNVSVASLLDLENDVVPEAFTDVIAFLEKHASDKERFFDGVVSKQAAIDLIIMDVPEGLSVPTISIPPGAIPSWNQFSEDGLQAVFDLAENYLHDGGALLVMYPLSRPIQSYLKGFCVDFGLKPLKDWWGMNRLHLRSPTDPLATTMRFGLSLYVKATATGVQSKFSFQDVPAHNAVGVSVAQDDVLQNFCNKEDVTMNDKTPWRGPREKARAFMQMLIEATTLPGDVVMDCTAATGSTIFACRATGRHVVALEENKAIFEALLAPLISNVSTSEAQPAIEAASPIDLDEDEVPVHRIPKKSRFSKQAEKMNMGKHRPFFGDPKFLCSPPKPFYLPVYAEALALNLQTHDPKPSSRAHKVDPRVLTYIDDSTKECSDVSSRCDESFASTSSCSSLNESTL